MAKKGAEPVACAYGVERHGSTLTAGLLFARAGLKRRELVFVCPTTKEKRRLRLPEKLIGLAQDGYLMNAPMEDVTA